MQVLYAFSVAENQKIIPIPTTLNVKKLSDVISKCSLSSL